MQDGVILGDCIFILLFGRDLLGSEELFVRVTVPGDWSECKNGVVLGLGITVMWVFMLCLIMVRENPAELVAGDEGTF